ncbi:hypothetical protein B7P43_G03640 [Cryptotermes secundus]|uniref:Uncharacterized protein n=1 Tax=Cryptotermes secundus TaxID=105785 RepID=A0A2J7PSU4_9NEOP|nr:hypothetical protein B7P43_G03640 [Cryptotermes secundus]
MFWPNQPSSGVQVVMIAESAAHCNAVLFLLCGGLGLHLVMWVSHLFFDLGVLELLVFASWFCFAVAVLNVLAGVGICCVDGQPQHNKYAQLKDT